MVNPDGEASAGDAAADGDAEARILDAAQRVFMRRGTSGARMQEIADEAGVNKALLHYYFRSKERLAEAIFERAAKRLLPPMLAIVGSDAPLEDKVERVVAHYLDVLGASPFLPGYLLSELHHHPERVERLVTMATGGPAEGFAARGLAKVSAQIEERVRAGTMRPIDARQLAVNLLSLCVFPFAARPMLKVAFGWDQEAFEQFVRVRRRDLPSFFLNALRP